MTVYLYLAPAGGGKTSYVVHEARQAAAGLAAMPRICVASPLQRWSVRRRLAAEPGAIGVHTLLFDDLYEEILRDAGEHYTRLSDLVQYRLLRTLVLDLNLRYYARLVDRPGFTQTLQQLIGELKAARIEPAALTEHVDGSQERLVELAAIYAAYQERLQEQRWADRAGMGWLALERLQRQPGSGSRWSHLFVDGFDSFTVTQCDFLAAIAGNVGELVITLTGEPAAPGRSAHRRFAATRAQLEGALNVRASALPARGSWGQPVFRHLERSLFRYEAQQLDPGGAVQLLAAPDRAGEVREALRWLKEQHVQSGLPLHQFALLARDLDAYRAFIARGAASFGLPIYAQDGPPLAQNPLVAALLALLCLVLPAGRGEEGFALPRQGVIAAWRSPYFDWQSAVRPQEPFLAAGIEPGDAERLEAVALQGRVVGGYRQWLEALQLRPPAPAGDDASPPPDHAELRQKFVAFVERLRPPGEASFRTHVAWLEGLIGDDPQGNGQEIAPPEQSLQIVSCLERGGTQLAARDRAALLAFKEVLRGLVVAEATLGQVKPVPFTTFFQELAGAVEASFVPAGGEPDGALVVSSIAQARGLPFAAVAVLGLAEGSFPAGLREDPFLREEDRRQLRAKGLPLESTIVSREREYFYETITRPWQRLLLVRGRLADDGAVWQPSPFWDELRRLVAVEPVELGSGDLPAPSRAANKAEFLHSLVAHGLEPDGELTTGAGLRERWQWLQRAAALFEQRFRRRVTAHDGDLRAMAGQLAERFGAAHFWSPSQLETYLSCAFRFLAESALGLQPRPEGEFMLDAAQLGAIYHHILEQVYSALPAAERCDVGALGAALQRVAPRILDAAPEAYGFRPAAWWEQTRAEIMETAWRTLQTLAEMAGGYTPLAFERRFGAHQPLKLSRDGETILLRGVIDRVDRDEQGRVRIVDYKSSGYQRFSPAGLERGEHVQLPLYALAAEQALHLGPVHDAFYWAVRDARPGSLRLGPDNMAQAVSLAVEHTWAAVAGVRQGQFAPRPPAGGCPSYCAAAAFCWHFRPRFSP